MPKNIETLEEPKLNSIERLPDPTSIGIGIKFLSKYNIIDNP